MIIIDLSYPRKFIQHNVKKSVNHSLFFEMVPYNVILASLPLSKPFGNNIANMDFLYSNIFAILETMKSINYYKLNAMKNFIACKKRKQS